MKRRLSMYSASILLSVCVVVATGCGKQQQNPPSGNSPTTPPSARAESISPKISASSVPAHSSTPAIVFSGFARPEPVEAEFAALTFPMQKGKDGGAGYITVPETETKEEQYKAKEGLAALTFSVPEDGRHQVWFRRWWDSECADSFYINFDGETDGSGEKAWLLYRSLPNNYKTWTWSRLKNPRELKAGRHVLYITNGSDGWRLDKIIVTADLDYVPQD